MDKEKEEISELLEIYDKVPLFENMSKEEVSALSTCFKVSLQSFERGEIALMQGFSVNKIGILLKGELRAYKSDQQGRSQLVSKIFPFKAFGDILACTLGKKSPVTVVAESFCRVIFIDAQNILSPCQCCCRCHSLFLANFLRLVSTKYFEREYMLELLSKNSLRGRLCGYFYEMHKRKGDSFEVDMNTVELSQHLSVNRSAMSRELSRLKKENILSFQRGKADILDKEALRREANS